MDAPCRWRCVQSATIVSVAGVRFENQKTLKGEADVLLVDPDGVVQVSPGWVGVCGV